MWSFIKLTIWAVIWVILWCIIFPFRKKGHHNCLSWALDKWNQDKDSYLVIRWARNSKYTFLQWPHFLYLDKKYHGNLEHAAFGKIEKRVIPRFYFEPRIIQGDDKEDGEE